MGALSPVAVLAEGLTKRFGSTRAVDELDLEVLAGEVFGLVRSNVGRGMSLPEGDERPTTVQARRFCEVVQAGSPRTRAYRTLITASVPQPSANSRRRHELVRR